MKLLGRLDDKLVSDRLSILAFKFNENSKGDFIIRKR